MKNWKKYAGLLLAAVLCLCLAACGDKSSNAGEGSNDGEIRIEDLEGYWYPTDRKSVV